MANESGGEEIEPDGSTASGGLIRSAASRRVFKVLGIYAVAYVAFLIAMQAGLRSLVLIVLAVVGGYFLSAVFLGFLRYRVSSVLIAGVIPLALWLAVWGSYSFTRDLLGGALALALAWPATRLFTHWRHTVRGADRGAERLDRPRRRLMRRFVIIGFLFIWVINSGLNVIFESRPEARTASPLVAAQASDAPWRTARVGVALSGGGYRAALMHAGVLAELDAMRIPVTALSAVSGGSIIGSFYAAGGAPETFRDVIAKGRLNLKRDMADIHNTLRLPFPAEIPYLDVSLLPWFAFGRVDVQANLVDRVLLDGTTLRDMRDPTRPRLQICATDLRSGVGVGLAADGVQMRSPPRPARDRSGGRIPYEFTRAFHPAVDPDTRVASLVAASGAFPGAFNAVRLTLPAAPGVEDQSLLLADGGIVDNWGVGLLLDRFDAAPPDDPWKVDVLVISAGGRIFEVGEDVPTPNQLRRAVDIVYETAGWHPIESVVPPNRPPMLLLQPGDADRRSPEYQTFAETTTLTDDFTGAQAQRLFDLGRQLVKNSAPEFVSIVRAAQAR